MNHNKENEKISNGETSGENSLSDPSALFLQEFCTHWPVSSAAPEACLGLLRFAWPTRTTKHERQIPSRQEKLWSCGIAHPEVASSSQSLRAFSFRQGRVLRTHQGLAS